MMSTAHLLDSQIREFFEKFPKFALNDATLSAVRVAEAASIKIVEDLPESVSREEVYVPGLGTEPEVRCWVYRPTNSQSSMGAYLHMHGGGMVMGAVELSDARCVKICDQLGVVVISVDYRLAPENPFPAGLHDAYAALGYLHKNVEDLFVDPERIAVGGESAGAGLAASLAIFVRSKGSYPICHQQLVYPMLDDRTGQSDDTVSDNLGEFIWTADYNRYGWRSYLGETVPSDAYIPARTQDLSNLPPAWLGVGDMDLFLPENRTYAERLCANGVQVSVNIYRGAPHGFYAIEKADISQKFEHDFIEALSKGLEITT